MRYAAGPPRRHRPPVILLTHMLKAPALTGAVAGSSQHLARAMADAAHGADHLIELGAGTGAVTQQLHLQYPDVQLTVVELQPTLARRLARAYPRARVHAAPAAEVLDRMDDGSAATALVSGLPFRSLPATPRRETRASILHFLRRNPGSWLVQFTYLPRAPFDADDGFVWTRGRTVVANLPPAGVWILRGRD